MEEKKHITISHRGVVSLYQENTEDALKESISQGYDIIDLNAMVTEEGEIVCCHDKNVKDMVYPHVDTYIQCLSREEIQQLVIDKEVHYPNKTVKYDQYNSFAFLPQLFDKYIDKTIIWIDVKGTEVNQFSCCGSKDESAEVLNLFLRERKDKLSRAILSSSNHLFTLRLLALAIKDGYGHLLNICYDYGDNFYNKILTKLDFEKIRKPTYVAIERTLATQDKIDEMNEEGIKVIVYSYGTKDKLDFTGVYAYLYDC